MTNHLFYGDNLQVLRENIADESVDLIYLDPPFNSQLAIPLVDPAAFKKAQAEPRGKQQRLL